MATSSAADTDRQRGRMRVRTTRSRCRNTAKNSPQAVEAYANFKACRLGYYIEKILAEAPPLNDEQRTRLAELLRPVRRNGGA